MLANITGNAQFGRWRRRRFVRTVIYPCAISLAVDDRGMVLCGATGTLCVCVCAEQTVCVSE